MDRCGISNENNYTKLKYTKKKYELQKSLLAGWGVKSKVRFILRESWSQIKWL